MKALLIQKDIRDLDYKKHLDEASRRMPDLVCFGELATSGCLYNGGEVPSYKTIVRDLADYSFSTFIGLPRLVQGRLYNSYVFVNGEDFQFYDKINLFEPMNEPKVFTPGDSPGIIDTPFGRFGVAICYDLRFPDLFRQLADAGADKIVVPAAFPKVRITDWKELIACRAKETGLYVLGINAVGNDGLNEFGGSTIVCDPSGNVVALAGESGEEIVELII